MLEMETTSDEKNRLREIIQAVITGNKAFTDEKFILVGKKNGFWVLNYIQGPRNDYNRLVRGMVIQQPPAGFTGDPLSLIKSFPFVRFFNQGEKEAAPINFSNSEMLEKMDGTMVGVFFPDNNPANPQWHTRKMVSAHPEDMGRSITNFSGKTYKFMPVIGEYVKQLRFSPEDAQYTYVFEFVHDASYVMTKYSKEQFGLYLLGARHLPTHRELTEKELDAIATRVGSRRPRRWDAIASHDEITAMMKEIGTSTTDFEGFVFRDRETGGRVKMKDADYVRKHHMLDDSRSIKSLLPMILKGEEDEVLAYFPQAGERVEEIKNAYQNYLDKTVAKVIQWQTTGLTGQELSYKLFGQNTLPKWQQRLNQIQGVKSDAVTPGEADSFVRLMILKNHKVQGEEAVRANVDKAMRQIALGQGTNAGAPKELMDMIGLNDREEASADVGEV